MQGFNWDDMQPFLAVAREGQLSAAARRLGSSHVTVARRIDRLEAALRQRLFERNPRGYQLTPAGKRLLEAAERMEQASEGVTRDEGPGSSLGGSLRLAVPEGFASLFCQHLLARMQEAFPGIALELVTLTQVLSLSRREADLSVTLDPISRGGYRSELLAEYALGLYAAPELLARHAPIRSREDLPALPCIGYIEEMLLSPALDYLREVHPSLRPRFKSASLFNQRSAAIQGLGLCVLPCYLGDATPRLEPVLPQSIRLTRRYWLSMHEDQAMLRRERAVIAHLKDAMARLEPSLAG